MSLDFPSGIPHQILEGSWAGEQEAEATRKVPKGQYMLARLDGRAFSAFTQPMKKPFDETFTNLMIETTKHVMHQLGANIAFTQSDEMTFCWWFPADSESDYPFAGRLQKICSLSAALASTFFASKINWHVNTWIEEGLKGFDRILDQPPLFDARVWGCQTDEAAIAAFSERERDCQRNAVSMVAHAFISPKKLMNVSTRERLVILEAMGVNYDKYPLENRYGSYIIRKKVPRLLTEQELDKIPVAHRIPGLTVTKTEYSRAYFSSLAGAGPLKNNTWD